jgi:hypothetical protein
MRLRARKGCCSLHVSGSAAKRFRNHRNLRASLSARQTKRTEGRKGAAAAEHRGRNDCHAAMFIEMNPRPIF